jgi:Spy/CpxP family protein refolding chaperone
MKAAYVWPWFNRIPSLLASACLATGISTAALAQSMPLDQPLASEPAALAAGDLTDDLEAQPDSPDDLAVDDLTDEQIAEMEAIFTTYQPQIQAAVADYDASLAALGDTLIPQSTDAQITQARNNVVAAEKALDDLVFERNLALRSVLTADQRLVINDYLRAWLGLEPVAAVVMFPQTLVGLEVDEATDDLAEDGWVLVLETPSQLSFNRASDQLDLYISRSGLVSDAFLNE